MINSELSESEKIIVKGLVALDFIIDHLGVIWFCGEGIPIRYNILTGEYDQELRNLLCEFDFHKLEIFRKHYLPGERIDGE